MIIFYTLLRLVLNQNHKVLKFFFSTRLGKLYVHCLLNIIHFFFLIYALWNLDLKHSDYQKNRTYIRRKTP